MGSLTYAAMLVFVVVAVTPLELVLRAGVARRARRLALTVVCAGVPFVVWDLLAVHAGHWTFGPDRILGWVLPGGLPVEEVSFFVVVPVASVLSLEAVRRFWGWRVGDESEREARR
ncbi:hypothetical protein GCM10023340_14340 [Nocardioides marinquilinus]|uniref:Lycopene cyclase domain-containing protein n=1 Tax=Nocardioides marinquilinus TaxID=1210400 RepID=A0ABP9PI64_9ACTN